MDQLDDGRGQSAFEEAGTVAVGPVGYWNLAWRTFGCVLTGAVSLVAMATLLGMGAAGVQAAAAGGEKGMLGALQAMGGGMGAVGGAVIAAAVLPGC
jgi:hypothetical protein